MRNDGATRVEFGKRLATVWAATRATAEPLPDETMRAYWLGLADLEFAAVSAACSRAVRECRRFPAVSELRALAGEQSPEARALAAFHWLTHNLHVFRTPRLILFDDPALAAAINLCGGPRRFLLARDEELTEWVRREFVRCYSIAQAPEWQRQHCRGVDYAGSSTGYRLAYTGLPWAVDFASYPAVAAQRAPALEVRPQLRGVPHE